MYLNLQHSLLRMLHLHFMTYKELDWMTNTNFSWNFPYWSYRMEYKKIYLTFVPIYPQSFVWTHRETLKRNAYNEICSDNLSAQEAFEIQWITTETGNWTHAVAKRPHHVQRSSPLYQTAEQIYQDYYYYSII